MRCKSMKDDDLDARCWQHRRDGSDFCEYHQHRPNLYLALTDFFREWEGRIITEKEFSAWEKARFPNAAR